MTHIHSYEWIEEPGWDPSYGLSRTLEWVRRCDCGFSPDDPCWRVLITGSRDHTDRQLIHSALDAELAHARFLGVRMVVVEGQCPYGGADALAEEYALATDGVDHDPIPAHWEALGKIAGPHRNQEMVDRGADACLSFPLPGSRGTYDCMRRAEVAGIPVKMFETTISEGR